MLFWCDVGFAKAYKVKLKDKNKYGTVFRISLPLASDKADKWDKAFQKTIDISNKNCKKYNKKTFAFWSEHSGQYARDENGMLFPKTIAKDTWGIIQDMEPMFKVKVRYFCGENIEEAVETFNNYHRYFSEEFSSTIKLETIKYSETSVSPYKFKNIGGGGQKEYVHIAEMPDGIRGKWTYSDNNTTRYTYGKTEFTLNTRSAFKRNNFTRQALGFFSRERNNFDGTTCFYR